MVPWGKLLGGVAGVAMGGPFGGVGGGAVGHAGDEGGLPRVGFLTDAFAVDQLSWALLDGLRNGTEVPIEGGRLQFRPTSRMAGTDMRAPLASTRVTKKRPEEESFVPAPKRVSRNS